MRECGHETSLLLLQSTLALRTPRYCGRSLLRTKSRSPAKDSRYYGISLIRNYGHFLGTKVTILLC